MYLMVNIKDNQYIFPIKIRHKYHDTLYFLSHIDVNTIRIC